MYILAVSNYTIVVMNELEICSYEIAPAKRCWHPGWYMPLPKRRDGKRLQMQVISYIDIVLTLTPDSVSSHASFY